MLDSSLSLCYPQIQPVNLHFVFLLLRISQLDQICISFDNGKTTMNFIEAALLIQGSACIYSRKVRRLAVTAASWPWSCCPACSAIPQLVVLRLSSTGALWERWHPGSAVPCWVPSPVSIPPCLPLQTVDVIPLTPMCLVPPEEADKRDNPLFSRNGEILASRKDFRMNMSTPHTTGAFLLEPAGLSPICPQEQQLEVSPGRAAGTGDSGHRSPELCRLYLCSLFCQEMLDPWQSLDPFSDSEDKPFKKGRPFLVPHGLDDVVGGKRKRKGLRKLQDFMEWFSAACEYCGCRVSWAPQGCAPCLCADLEVLYWKEQKLRMAAQRKLQSRAVSGVPHPHSAGGGGCVVLLLVTLCPPAGPPDLGSLGYEELVRRNVELFIANSQKYAQETELSQHIRCWEERIGPLLQEQEERATFDIHGYGDTLASSCRRLGEWRSFASLVAGEPPFEVCRYMLATLQLANDSVVELAQDPGLEEALDTARLRFLTHQRPQERFHTFQPPSACP
uniref:Condensin-2 complex subunit H2 n=1 Tax=Accipiter nisus TaxID=211598 RepID=A0A8B9MZV5_9AVES